VSAVADRARIAAAEAPQRPVGKPELLRSASGTRDVAIAGIPRSGSTLACHLLNRLPDAVALHEPFALSGFRRWPGVSVGSERALRGVMGFFAAARASLRACGHVVSKHADGEIPDNPIGDGARGAASLRTLMRRGTRRLVDGRALRRGRVVRGVVRIGKPLSDDFLLCVKHPSIFTGLLPRLVDHYPCFATVRNPIAVLGSWNSIEFAVSEGRSRAAERLDPQLRSRLERCGDRGERQLRLLEWYFDRIARWLRPERVLRYEDVVSTRGELLARIGGASPPACESLENRNRNCDYDVALVLELGERLLAAPGAWSAFYPVASLEGLLAEIDAGTKAQATPSGSAWPRSGSAEEGTPGPRGWL
jgi:hypothetical protein